MKIVCVSDTHGLMHRIDSIPDGDVLIHAGDCTNVGKLDDLARFNDFLKILPHRYKLCVSGNHDWNFQLQREKSVSILTEAIYLQDSGVLIDGIKFYASPWQRQYCDWSFNLPADKLKDYWDKIPEDTDVLITHSPPFGFGDRNLEGENCGCPELLAAVERIKPRAHVYGHIHEGYGKYRNKHTKFYNVSTCTRQYIPSNPPVVFTLQEKRRKKCQTDEKS